MEKEIQVELTHSPCGHTRINTLWGEEDLEGRKERIQNLPCWTCMELNRISCGKVDGIYSSSLGATVKRFNEHFPDWRECVPVVKTLPTSFNVESDARNHWLEKLLEAGN